MSTQSASRWSHTGSSRKNTTSRCTEYDSAHQEYDQDHFARPEATNAPDRERHWLGGAWTMPIWHLEMVSWRQFVTKCGSPMYRRSCRAPTRFLSESAMLLVRLLAARFKEYDQDNSFDLSVCECLAPTLADTWPRESAIAERSQDTTFEHPTVNVSLLDIGQVASNGWEVHVRSLVIA